MANQQIIAPAEDQIADGTWRPVQNSRGEWNIIRRWKAFDAKDPICEIHGAQIDGPAGKRFCAFNVFRREDAQMFCDNLNAKAEKPDG